MPRRNLLTSNEQSSLLAFPSNKDDVIRYYTFTEQDLAVIRQHRGNHNRLGFAVQLCYLRYPGCALPTNGQPPEVLLSFITEQLGVEPEMWQKYAKRAETRREHLLELQHWLGLTPFGKRHFGKFVRHLADVAEQTDRAIVLATTLLELLRQNHIIIPMIDVVERVCAEALTRGTRSFYESLTKPLTSFQKRGLDKLLALREASKYSLLSWLRQPPGTPNAKHVLEHIERLRIIRSLELPDGLERSVHQNRLLKLAREGSQMTSQHLRDLEPGRRYSILTAIVLDTQATLIDEIIDMHDRILGKLFSKAKRNHADRFEQSGKTINDKLQLYTRIGRVLLEARQAGSDPFAAIETVLPWHDFAQSVTETETLTRPGNFDFLPLIAEGFGQIRRYAPDFLETLQFQGTPAAQDVLTGVGTIKDMNERQARKVPDDAPTGFVRKRWDNIVHNEDGIDRRFYELCVLSELKNSLRSGDIWAPGSRQFKDFEEYLLPSERFTQQREQQRLGLSVKTECDHSLETRMALLASELGKVERLAKCNELPDAAITESGLRLTPLDNAVPDDADKVTRQAYAMIPHLKITELLLEVDHWTNFTSHFTHMKSGEQAADKSLLLTAILADAINLGLTKMAESCPGTTYSKLSWLQAWHIRDETYSAGLAELVNAQFQQPLAKWWGDGTTSSSDGQWFRAGGVGHNASHFNGKYGNDPGVTFYTHISDQYAPYYTKVINANVRDATHVLDGLLYHESDLRIEEHYTDTAGFTDHVFALMPILGFMFAPRIRDLKEKKLYVPDSIKSYPTLSSLLGGTINQKHIRAHWDEVLRLAASIKQGTVTASLMLRKLGSYPRQNGLAVALRELGRIERTLFTLDWLQNVELRRRVQVGLNKGEAKNALARAVFFNRLGEMRDRSFENQRHRASGLNLVVAAIVLWNTVYLDRAVRKLRTLGSNIDDTILQHISPLGWEHINLTGDYVWPKSRKTNSHKFRLLNDIRLS